MAPASPARQRTEEALDAAEPLPVSVGSAQSTTRALAAEIGRDIDHRSVETDDVAIAAAQIAEFP
jgi:hypothetical protein